MIQASKRQAKELQKTIGDKELRVYQRAKTVNAKRTDEHKTRAHPHICCISVPPMAHFP
jgi:hypothetical protein